MGSCVARRPASPSKDRSRSCLLALFKSEGVDTLLLVLKRKVKKLIEDENARHPLTDDQLAALLQSQGIQLTRRTVAKYREDMGIPSTHQRRSRD
jgi:RNA polymerase sigma-54 factor